MIYPKSYVTSEDKDTPIIPKVEPLVWVAVQLLSERAELVGSPNVISQRSALDVGEDLRLSVLNEDNPVVARGLAKQVTFSLRTRLNVFALEDTHQSNISRQCRHRFRQCRKWQQREQEDIEIAFHFSLLSCSIRQNIEQNQRLYFSNILRWGSNLPQTAHSWQAPRSRSLIAPSFASCWGSTRWRRPHCSSAEWLHPEPYIAWMSRRPPCSRFYRIENRHEHWSRVRSRCVSSSFFSPTDMTACSGVFAKRKYGRWQLPATTPYDVHGMTASHFCSPRIFGWASGRGGLSTFCFSLFLAINSQLGSIQVSFSIRAVSGTDFVSKSKWNALWWSTGTSTRLAGELVPPLFFALRWWMLYPLFL